MLLGKRPRPPIKRTTSMTEFTLDLSHTAAVVGGHDNNHPQLQQQQQQQDPNNPFNMNPPRSTDGLDHRFLSATVSPRNHRRNSADHIETAHFLKACHLCNRRLIPGRDIFMYRGDAAFCSSECRQQQMSQDEKKDKFSLVSNKKQTAASATNSSAASETVGVAAV